MSRSPLIPRSQVPVEQTWDTASIFATPDDWRNAVDQLELDLPAAANFRGHLGESPQTLLQWLETWQALSNRMDHIFLYANLGSAVDITDAAAKALSERAGSLGARVGAALAFAEPEILSIGFERLREWVQAEPRLTLYTHYFERLERRAAHIRSAEVEELLNQARDPLRTAGQTHGILVNADMTFPNLPATGSEPPVELAHSNIGQQLASRARARRQAAWEAYADAHLAFKHTQANCLAAQVKNDVFQARARGYASSLEAALAPGFIPTEVFHNLIAVFRRSLPTWQRYWELRRRVLGVEEMHVYDTRAALIERMPVIPFEQAVDWISEGMRPLGEDYVNVLRRGVLHERWVDRSLNKGKRYGAFSSGVKGSHPFILMSYNDDIFSLSTLAHELGHSMHSYYSRGTQPQIYAQYGLFLAEVASNFNQAMVRAYLLEHETERDLQIAIIEEAMNNYHRYFFVMPTLARFELEIHTQVERGEALTARSLIDLMAALFAEGYGAQVEQDHERVGSVWMQFSTHLYMNFYVYQYATGISGAQALADGVLSGSDEARQRYLGFLASGGSQFPLETLRQAGVDLASPAPVETAFAGLENLVTRLETLLG